MKFKMNQVTKIKGRTVLVVHEFDKHSCQSCKQKGKTHISKIMGQELEGYKAYHGKDEFYAYECHSCGHKWHFKKDEA